MEEKLISEAMLMSAGLGTRLRPFTERIPKVLLPVMGVPIAQYVLDSLLRYGVTRVVANVHHHAIQAQSGLMALEGAQGRVQTSDESSRLLGSAGGIRHALGHFSTNTFFYMNGDVLCDLDWASLASCHFRLRASHGVNITLAVFPESPAGENYREILYDPFSGLIQGLGEKKSRCTYFIGAAVIEKGACGQIPSEGPADFVSNILEPAIACKKAGVFISSGSWYDIGSPSLWFQSHLALIDRLETGRWESPESRQWKARIEKTNQRVGERIWTSRGSPVPTMTSRWRPSVYWDGRGTQGEFVPKNLGSDSVLYGSGNAGRGKYQRGIGIGDLWVNF